MSGMGDARSAAGLRRFKPYPAYKGAHYREATRARSNAEFISKIEGGLQELEETRYWFELLRDAQILSWDRLAELDREADELTAILVTFAKKRKTASP